MKHLIGGRTKWDRANRNCKTHNNCVTCQHDAECSKQANIHANNALARKVLGLN